MAAICNWDSTSVTIFNIDYLHYTITTSSIPMTWSGDSNYSIVGAKEVRYPYYVNGVGCLDAKEYRLARNEVHSRECWRTPRPARVRKYSTPRPPMCRVFNAPNLVQRRSQKRKQYLRRLNENRNHQC